MPLYPGGPRLGFGLWRSVLATVIVKGAMFAAGVWIYVRVTRAKDRTGRWALWSFVAALALVYVANILSPAPTAVMLTLVAAIAFSWLMIWWSGWADRHREPR